LVPLSPSQRFIQYPSLQSLQYPESFPAPSVCSQNSVEPTSFDRGNLFPRTRPGSSRSGVLWVPSWSINESTRATSSGGSSTVGPRSSNRGPCRLWARWAACAAPLGASSGVQASPVIVSAQAHPKAHLQTRSVSTEGCATRVHATRSLVGCWPVARRPSSSPTHRFALSLGCAGSHPLAATLIHFYISSAHSCLSFASLPSSSASPSIKSPLDQRRLTSPKAFENHPLRSRLRLRLDWTRAPIEALGFSHYRRRLMTQHPSTGRHLTGFSLNLVHMRPT
jgi:hypothetical protein